MAFTPSTLKRKRLYYSPEDDLVLLREVAGHNPYEDGGRWNIIEKNVQEATRKAFKKRSLQDRVANLTEKYQKKLEEDQFKSGIEENVTEIDDLITSVVLLIKDFKHKTPKATAYQIGYERREAAVDMASENLFEDYEVNPNIMIEIADEIENVPDYDITDEKKEQGCDENNEKALNINGGDNGEQVIRGKGRGRSRGRGGGIGTTSKQRCSLKFASIKFLEKKNDRWYELRKRELDLEEKRFLLEKAEREKRIEIEEKTNIMEEKRLQAELAIFDNQQKLMEIAFNLRNRETFVKLTTKP